ncbi:MAG: hypothetical protein QOI51_1775 [Nocardioidaceae bacterium]|nr:hypothetical protein [Nocardioidaceae bacterium]MDX6309702.1 hypothetical protein [Nocardioidaceae bacterium]
MTTSILPGPSPAGRPASIGLEHVGLAEAAQILGCSVSTVRRYLDAGRLTRRQYNGQDAFWRGDVEALASEVYAWRRHLEESDSYWVTGQQAADVLGVSRSRLGQLAIAHRLAHVQHQDGTRLYPRHRLERQAKDARRTVQ